MALAATGVTFPEPRAVSLPDRKRFVLIVMERAMRGFLCTVAKPLVPRERIDSYNKMGKNGGAMRSDFFGGALCSTLGSLFESIVASGISM
jgi:hypothetical protein